MVLERNKTISIGGGFKYLLFSPRKLGKISNLTQFFKRVETCSSIFERILMMNKKAMRFAAIAAQMLDVLPKLPKGWVV